MNGWDEGHPAWWLNLEAHPDAVVQLARQQPRRMHARAAVGEERARLWQRWVAVDPRLDAYAVRRSTETSVIVLEPARPDRLTSGDDVRPGQVDEEISKGELLRSGAPAHRSGKTVPERLFPAADLCVYLRTVS